MRFVDDGDDHGAAWRQLVGEPFLQPRVDLLLGELAHQTTHGAADRDRGQHRRGEQPDEHTHPATPAETFAAEVVGGVGDRDLAVARARHEDDALGSHGGALDRGNEIVEVGLRGIGIRVRSQDQVESVGHARTRFSEGGRQPILSPVPGGGASSVPDEPAHTSRQALTPPESESTGANTAGEAVSEPTFASDLADVTAVLSTLVTPTDTVSDDCGRAHHRRRPGDRASDHAGPSHSSWSDGHVSLLRSPHRRRRGAPGSGFDRWR